MRIIARSTLTGFVQSRARPKDHLALKGGIQSWFHEVKAADWHSMADIKAAYRTSSIINSERVVFNIKGNDYRLIAAIDFRRKIVFVKWIGSHEDYDQIDAKTVQHER